MIETHHLILAAKEVYGDDVTVVRRNGVPFRSIDRGGEAVDEPLPPEVIARAEALAAVQPAKSWARALDFKMEFTPQERNAMRQFAKTDATAEDFLDLLNSAGRIVADDPMLIQGLGYFVTKKVLTQTRINQVLGK